MPTLFRGEKVEDFWGVNIESSVTLEVDVEPATTLEVDELLLPEEPALVVADVTEEIAFTSGAFSLSISDDVDVLLLSRP